MSERMNDAHATAWWQHGIIYQVYPRSFLDADGDGVGDLAGLATKLDYLEALGVTALWISPIYPSPMKDFGYDIADYTDVDPLFGTLEELDALIEAAHSRDLKVILDFVPNHTSDRHPWFVEARASRDAPKRDWYLWHDPAPDGGPPNNWRSVFGGSGWEWDEATGQYYYHAFLPEQPDLNWRNPDVQRAMLDVLRFWLDRGVDGFRVDVIWHLVKDDRLRDDPGLDDAPHDPTAPIHSSDRPEVHDVIRRMRELVDEYPDRVLIGEIYLPIQRVVAYYGRDGRGVHLPFNFLLIEEPWDARRLAAAIQTYEALLPTYGWPNWVLGNHDKPRVASRIGPRQARVAAMLLLTLRGTPTLYYGEEIGMHDVPIPPERVSDPVEHRLPGLGLGRDPQRTPMQWDGGPGAGFTTGEPWLPIADDHDRVNLEAERGRPDSMFSLYRRLIQLRQAEPAFSVGEFAPLEAPEETLAYVRKEHERLFLVALNLGQHERQLELERAPIRGEVVISTHGDRTGEAVHGDLALRADEGVIVRLER